MSPELEKRLEELKSEKMATIVMPKSISNGLIDLLERDTAKRPVKRMSGERECPNCEIALARNYLVITFCPNCGQRIDWSE